jgi:hypothetical protein
MPVRKRSPKAEAVKEAVSESPKFSCSFCSRSFRYEAHLVGHSCRDKERFFEKDEKYAKLAFRVFQRFHEISYKSTKQQTWEQFSKSRHYTCFINFGKYLTDVNAVNPQTFVDFLIKKMVPIDRWTSPVVYETYLRDLNKRESADAAMERNFLLMQQWAVENGEVWTDFFRKVPPALAVLWIRSGRVSPWVLYTAPSAQELLARLSNEQVALIEPALDPVFWQAKLGRHAADVEFISETLADAGL